MKGSRRILRTFQLNVLSVSVRRRILLFINFLLWVKGYERFFCLDVNVTNYFSVSISKYFIVDRQLVVLLALDKQSLLFYEK